MGEPINAKFKVMESLSESFSKRLMGILKSEGFEVVEGSESISYDKKGKSFKVKSKDEHEFRILNRTSKDNTIYLLVSVERIVIASYAEARESIINLSKKIFMEFNCKDAYIDYADVNDEEPHIKESLYWVRFFDKDEVVGLNFEGIKSMKECKVENLGDKGIMLMMGELPSDLITRQRENEIKDILFNRK